MSDIIRYQGDLRSKQNPMVAEVIKQLGEPGTKNYSRFVSQLSGVDLSDDDKRQLTQALFADLEKHIQYGHFDYIKFAREFMDFLGVTEFEFSPETIAKIIELYNRYSYGFLLEMSPSLRHEQVGGKWEARTWDQKLYDEMEHVREMMKKAGMADSSDETINELWKYREILIKLHNNHWEPQKQIGQVTKLLTT